MKPGVGGALTGSLLFVASPGMDVWPVVFVALIPLMLVVERVSFQRAISEGLIAGVFLYAPGLSWLPDSLNRASFAPGVIAWLGYVMLVVASAARLGLACVIAWLLVRARVSPTLAFGGAFAASELALPGFVPYTIAASLHSVSTLLQIAEWGGATWIVVLLSAINAQVAQLFARPSWRERTLELTAILALLSGWVGLGLWQMKLARATLASEREASRVLVVQPAIPSNLKRTKPSEIVAIYRDATRRALAEARPDWIVWGETTLASPVEESQLEPILRLRTHGGFGVPLLTGVAVQGDALHNSAVSVDVAGRVCPSCRYDKRRLVPFVEAWPVPFARVGATERGSQRTFKSGSLQDSVRIGEHVVSVGICYEALYADDFRDQVSKTRSELLVSLASDLWMQSERAKKLHLALIRLRAIEHRRFLIHATQGAASAAIDPTGSLRVLESDGSAEAMIADIRWLDTVTFWARAGNLPFWALFSALVAGRGLGWARLRYRIRRVP